MDHFVFIMSPQYSAQCTLVHLIWKPVCWTWKGIKYTMLFVSSSAWQWRHSEDPHEKGKTWGYLTLCGNENLAHSPKEKTVRYIASWHCVSFHCIHSLMPPTNLLTAYRRGSMLLLRNCNVLSAIRSRHTNASPWFPSWSLTMATIPGLNRDIPQPQRLPGSLHNSQDNEKWTAKLCSMEIKESDPVTEVWSRVLQQTGGRESCHSF